MSILENAQDKQVVKYSSVTFPSAVIAGLDVVGTSAYVVPVDHPSIWVTNGKVATTSPIVEYDETTGIFETLNTVYVPE